MALDTNTLQQWTNMWGEIDVPQTINMPEKMRPVAVTLLQLLIDSDYLLPLLEQQPNKSAIDFILALLVWKDEGLMDAYEEGINGLIKFATHVTPSEYISRSRRVLSNEGERVWRLPVKLMEQSEQAERSMRSGFSKGNYDEENGQVITSNV